MRKTSLILAAVFWMAAGTAATSQDAPNIYESTVAPTPVGELDKIVFARLSSLDVQPVLCSDAVFVRRAYLDAIGTLPTAKEARQFIRDPDTANKRRVLIDRLLERDEFADYWSMKWGDVLRIKAEFPINLWPNAAQAYHRWVRSSIVEDKPYDRFVREMLTSSGSNFRVGPVNFYRAIQNKTPEGTATAVALTFMGTRTESWPADRLSGMSAFFSQIGYKPTAEWKEENVFWDPLNASAVPGNVAPGQAAISTSDKPAEAENDSKGEAPAAPDGGPMTAVFPDGTKIDLPADRDPREVFADWLITPENPWFTRSVVNRVWAWLMGRGIIHAPDDIREDNRPVNPELLAYLERELVAHDYDLKHLYRLILNSSTYQFSSVSRFEHAQASANFASYPLRRLEAEVLIDAVNKITGTTDLYTSAIPEPFTYIPRDRPAIALADGSITSPFLALFGRSARATGTEDERKNRLGPAQWLHMLNSSHIQGKLDKSPRLKAIFTSGGTADEIVEKLYLTVLSRPPTPEEVAVAKEYGGGKMSRNTWLDVTWGLINSTEFLYRH